MNESIFEVITDYAVNEGLNSGMQQMMNTSVYMRKWMI